jgi:hypothetical protein
MASAIMTLGMARGMKESTLSTRAIRGARRTEGARSTGAPPPTPSLGTVGRGGQRQGRVPRAVPNLTPTLALPHRGGGSWPIQVFRTKT